jgi:hypothetical protein
MWPLSTTACGCNLNGISTSRQKNVSTKAAMLAMSSARTAGVSGPGPN